jgi:hypothetical protein
MGLCWPTGQTLRRIPVNPLLRETDERAQMQRSDVSLWQSLNLRGQRGIRPLPV